MRILFVFMICFCLSAFAQPLALLKASLTEALTLPEVVDIALQNNPETTVSWARAKRMGALFGSARSAFYPSVRFRVSGSHNRDYKYPDGSEITFTNYSADLILSYLIFDGGERKANANAAFAALEAANWQADWTVQKILVNVLEKAYSLLNAEAALHAHLESERDAHQVFDSGKELYHAGLRSIVDLNALESAFIEAKIAVVQQQAEVKIARGRLAVSMGLSSDVLVSVTPLPDPLSLTFVENDLSSLIEIAQRQRSDLMAKRKEVDQKEALLEKSIRSYLPKTRFDGSIGGSSYVHDSDLGCCFRAQLSVEAPLFLGFESIYSKKMAASDLQATDAELNLLELEIALEVLSSSARFEAANQLLQLVQKNLDSSKKTYEGVFDTYKSGTLSFFDVIKAQQNLALARTRQSDAKARWYHALAELAYATGSIKSEDVCFGAF